MFCAQLKEPVPKLKHTEAKSHGGRKAINLTTIIEKHNAEAALILYTLF